MIRPPQRHAWRSFQQLTTSELYLLLRLRRQVFVVEQQCAYLDIDGTDQRADHLLAWDTDDDLSGYLRVFVPNPSDAVARIGRVATSSRHRGTGLGHWLMEEALGFVGRQYGDVAVELSTQAYLERFYSRLVLGDHPKTISKMAFRIAECSEWYRGPALRPHAGPGPQVH
jgi:ElaA protein